MRLSTGDHLRFRRDGVIAARRQVDDERDVRETRHSEGSVEHSPETAIRARLEPRKSDTDATDTSREVRDERSVEGKEDVGAKGELDQPVQMSEVEAVPGRIGDCAEDRRNKNKRSARELSS